MALAGTWGFILEWGMSSSWSILCWLMVRISLQFNGFWRRFSKNEGWRYFCHVPNVYIRKFQNWPSSWVLIDVDSFPFYRRGISSWFDACGLGIFFSSSDNKWLCICPKQYWELSGRLSENSSTNKTSLLVHLKFCCPLNDCQHPENPNWT